MTIEKNYYIEDPSPIYDDLMPHTLYPDKIESVNKFFDNLKKDFDNAQTDCEKVIRLVRNADVIFNNASANMQRMTIVCLLTALLTTIGGLGAAFCPKAYKKIRFACVCLTVVSAVLSLFAAHSISRIHTKASAFQGFFDRRWS
ncbi:MAG TPA: hypothetical protein VHK67_01605 [Rhabdochlamydiaceae bacterium]|jgi:hypothetical protein|nr:hypothetical protein [Rhabdochlamydiaceae bacterium]